MDTYFLNHTKLRTYFWVVFTLGILGTVQAQCTYTSAGAGNWGSITWTCVPGGGCACGAAPTATSNVVVAHNINLNVDYTTTGNVTVNASRTLSTAASGGGSKKNLSAGSVTVNGTLTPWDMTVSGNITVNAGANLHVQQDLTTSGGAFVNSGTVTIDRNSTLGGSYTNNGVATHNGAVITNGTFSNTNDFFANGAFTANNTFSNSDTLFVGGAFTNTVSGTNTGAMQVNGLFDNSETAAPGQTTFINNGNVWANGGLTNNGGLFTNNDFIKVVGNLRNNPGGILNGSGSWDVTINAINTAGGTITGGLDFCDYAFLRTCLAGCGTPACSTNCYINANPLVSPSGTIDSTDLRICGVRLLAPLAADHLTLTATRSTDGKVDLRWYKGSEENIANYTLHRSTGGGLYQTVYEQAQQFVTDKRVMHYYADATAPAGQLSYRVVRTDIDGMQVQSNIVILNNSTGASLLLYPNPNKGQMQISMAGLQSGKLILEIYDIQGKMLQHEEHMIEDTATGISLPLELNQAPGQYILKVNNGKTLLVERIVVQ